MLRGERVVLQGGDVHVSGPGSSRRSRCTDVNLDIRVWGLRPSPGVPDVVVELLIEVVRPGFSERR